MAGYTLQQMKNFSIGKKKSTTRRDLSNVRDALVNKQGKTHYYVWGNRIATLSPKTDRLNISDAGWRSKLTKQRLNKVLPDNEGHIAQRKGEWFLDRNNKQIPFRGSMTILVHEHLREVNGRVVRVRNHRRRVR